MKEIYFAGGCFWGVQKYMSMIKGVVSTEAGYANGKTTNPTYRDVCFMDTDHAEAVKIEYDESIISLKKLLWVYFDIIDPTTPDQQGADIGRQYRTGVYYTDPSDEAILKEEFEALKQKYKGQLVVTELKKLENYFPAEDEHQNFLFKNPKGYCHIGKSAFARIEEINNSI